MSLQDKLEELRSILARLRKVKTGDYVLASDHNDLVDAVNKVEEVLELIAGQLEEQTFLQSVHTDIVPESDGKYRVGTLDKRWLELNFLHARRPGIKLKEVYVSPEGGGDGSSPDSPTTLDEVLSNPYDRMRVRLLDGEYHVSKNYELLAQYIELRSYSGDASRVKIVFDTYVSGNYNVSYSISIAHGMLRFIRVTLENAPKIDPDKPWAPGGGGAVPLIVSHDCFGHGFLSLCGCVVNQSRDYFISAKHGCGGVILCDTTVNMSEDAKVFITCALGTVRVGIFKSTITSGYRWVNGYVGRDVMINIEENVTFIHESLPRSIIPRSDAAYDVGSSTRRWRNGYFSGTVYTGDIALANGWRITEHPQHGLVLVSPDGRKYALKLMQVE